MPAAQHDFMYDLKVIFLFFLIVFFAGRNTSVLRFIYCLMCLANSATRKALVMLLLFRTALMSFMFSAADQVHSREEALFSAVKVGDLSCVQAHIDSAQYARDEKGNTVLCLALTHRKLAIAAYLINHVPALNSEGSVVLQECRILGTQGWMARYDITNVSPLHLAVWWGYEKIVGQLLSAGVAVNAEDELGRTPLHYAATRNRHHLVPILLAAGANINARAPKVSTYSRPLEAAASVGACESMGVLVDHGAEVDVEVVKCACLAHQLVSVKYLNEKIGCLVKAGEDEALFLREILLAATDSPEIIGYILNLWLPGAHNALESTYAVPPRRQTTKRSRSSSSFVTAMCHILHAQEIETARRQGVGVWLLKERNAQLREKMLLLDLPKDLVTLLMTFVADSKDLDAALRFAAQYGQVEMAEFLRSIGASDREQGDSEVSRALVGRKV